eukprot:5922693-Prymnesium_polylepis.2
MHMYVVHAHAHVHVTCDTCEGTCDMPCEGTCACEGTCRAEHVERNMSAHCEGTCRANGAGRALGPRALTTSTACPALEVDAQHLRQQPKGGHRSEGRANAQRRPPIRGGRAIGRECRAQQAAGGLGKGPSGAVGGVVARAARRHTRARWSALARSSAGGADVDSARHGTGGSLWMDSCLAESCSSPHLPRARREA